MSSPSHVSLNPPQVRANPVFSATRARPVRSPRRRLDRTAFAAALLAFAVGAAARPAAAMPRNVHLGDSLVPAKLNDLDGKPVDTVAFAGNPSVWIFVSAGQASSEKALADVQAALDSLVGVRIGAAAFTADAVQVPYFRQLCTRARLRIPVLLDPDREVYGRLGIIVLPTTLLIDKEGKLAQVLSGYDLTYPRSIQAHLAYLAGRVSADELKRRLATSQPETDARRERAERLCRSADILVRRGMNAEALAELQRAIEADPTCATASLRMADLHAAAGDLPRAEKMIAEVQSREPNNRQARLSLGTLRFRQGRFPEAEKLLKEALVLNPDPAHTHYWLARVYEAEKQCETAAMHYRAAAEQFLPDVQSSQATRLLP